MSGPFVVLEPVVGRAVEGELLVTGEPLSFWGGYDARTGEIIDRRHPLSGSIGRGKVLAMPPTRGSSTTTAVLLEAVRAGTAPAALVVVGVDQFCALASIVADEMYGTPIPLFSITAADLAELRSGVRVAISAAGVLTRLV
jgi:predicted aconitase with swiveling domain